MSRSLACTIGFLTALTIFLCAERAAAAPRNAITVSYHDLNPATPNGARILLARINKAAAKVCGGDPWKRRYTSETIIENREYTKCRDEAVSAAVAATPLMLVRQSYALAR